MNEILMIRSILIDFFKKYEATIIFILRFLLGLILINYINSIDYVSTELSFLYNGSTPIYINLIFSLLFAVLPVAGCYTILALQIAIRLSANTEIAIIVLLFLLCIIFFYVHLASKESTLILFIIIAFYFKVPYIVPMFSGIYFKLTSVIPIIIGVFIWQLLPTLLNLMATTKTAGFNIAEMPQTLTELLPTLIASLSSDSTWIFISFVFAMATLFVYVVSKLSFNYSKELSIAFAALLIIISYIIGIFVLKINIGVFSTLFFTIISAAVMEVILFFDIVLDYSRAEKVEFSDENNYYYVKIIPKKIYQKNSSSAIRRRNAVPRQPKI